jgi:DNA-repair protein complementing XP-A cells
MTGSNLTPELQERIRKNRERALKIQAGQKRKLEEELQHKTQRKSAEQTKKLKQTEDCEEWELGLSEWVTKKEAVSRYCLPEGTLAVCEVAIKNNPHHIGWHPMKLYRRAEVRERAYKRHGGKGGLIKERNKREQQKLKKDLEEADEVFASK